MQIILLVAQGKSYLPMTIKEKLERVSYQVISVPADTNVIYGVKETVNCIMIYADEELVSRQESLNFLKDKAIMDDIPVFTVGDDEELHSIRQIIPEYLIRNEFSRPVNVNDLVETVDTFMQQYSTQNKKKILVVDDSGAMLRNVKGWLGEKYNVFLANSGAMAIKYLALNRPHLILLDYEMPIVDGKQVLEMLRAEMEFNDIPVMFLTNKSDKDSIMNVKDLKPEAYLLKSMQPMQIIRAVDEFFEKRKAVMYLENA